MQAQELAQTAQAEADQALAQERRAQATIEGTDSKDRKLELLAEAKAVGTARKKAISTAKAKAQEAASAQQQIKNNTQALTKQKLMLSQVSKLLAERQTQAQAQARRDADIQAEEQTQIKQAENAAARAIRMQKLLEADLGMTLQPDAKISATDKVAELTTKDLGEKKWRLAVGVLYRRLGSQRFKIGSYSSGYAMEARSSDGRWTGPAGSYNDAGNRNYKDGYVRLDDYSDLDSGTWNWGYDSGRQVQGNTLELSGADRVWREYSRQSSFQEANASDGADYSGGLLLEAERYLAQTRYIDYGLRLGLAREQTFQGSIGGINTFQDNQGWELWQNRIVDSYDISGLGITPDSAPYRGNQMDRGPVIDTSPMSRRHRGNQMDRGPVIDTSPMSRRNMGEELVSRTTYRAYNQVSESLDLDLSTLSLGLTLKGKYQRLQVAVSTGPTLNLVEKDATYEETLYESLNGDMPRPLMHWKDSRSGTECLFGYYVQGEIGITIYRGLQAGVFGRYDWLENVSGNVGQSRYEVNPTGGSLGSTLGLQF